jgi:hypothetical protein
MGKAMRLRHVITASPLLVLLAAQAAASESGPATIQQPWRLQCTLHGGAEAQQDVFVTNVGTRGVPGGTKVRWTAGNASGEYTFVLPLKSRVSRVIGRVPRGSNATSCTAG